MNGISDITEQAEIAILLARTRELGQLGGIVGSFLGCVWLFVVNLNQSRSAFIRTQFCYIRLQAFSSSKFPRTPAADLSTTSHEPLISVVNIAFFFNGQGHCYITVSIVFTANCVSRSVRCCLTRFVGTATEFSRSKYTFPFFHKWIREQPCQPPTWVNPGFISELPVKNLEKTNAKPQKSL